MSEIGEPRRLPPELEERLMSILEGPPEGHRTALDTACAEHPEHAALARRRFAAADAMLRELLSVTDEVQPSGGSEDDPPQGIPDRLGDFRLLRRLGRGGMGVVYLARQESVGREVALKVMRPEFSFFEEGRERFRREIEAAGHLEHDGIVRVYTVGNEGGIPYLAMERVAGCTMEEVIQDLRDRRPDRLSGRDLKEVLRRRLPDVSFPEGVALFEGSWVEACLRIVRQVAEALAFAHGQRILHRDVKPSNIMVTVTGRAKLLDLGLAWFEGSTRMTMTGSTIGSLPYLPPERISDARAVPEGRMDVYSLGVTLYEMLSLELPFASGNTEEVRRLIAKGHPRPLRERNRAVTWDAETVCLKAMEIDPGRRYASAAELARDLGNVLALRPIEAHRPGRLLRLRRFCQRHPQWSVAAAVALALLVVGGLLLLSVERAATARVRLRQDAMLVNELVVSASTLFPVWPEDTGPAERWLAEARALWGRVQDHLAELTALEARALPRTPAEEAADLRRRELAEKQVALAESLRPGVGAATAPIDEDRVPAGVRLNPRGLVRALRRDVKHRYTWRFADPGDAALHPFLQRVVSQLPELERAIVEVARRRDRAEQADRVVFVEHAEAWEAARNAIATDPRYGGLRIAPQRGLVPIGPDPESGLHEFVHWPSGDPPARDPVTGRLRFTDASGIVLVLLPGGTFPMGSQRATAERPLGQPNVDPDSGSAATPIHDVHVGPFFLSKYEVTQSQWWRLTGTNPSCYPEGTSLGGQSITGLNPVETVDWLTCNQLMQEHGLALPTEEQWEYGARAGTTTPYWTGEYPDTRVGAENLCDRAYLRVYPEFRLFVDWDDGHAVHAPVGTFRANPFGLQDVLGNVAEWCQDEWQLTYESKLAGTKGPDSHGCRSTRGASFQHDAWHARSAYRGLHRALGSHETVGLRPARALEPSPARR